MRAFSSEHLQIFFVGERAKPAESVVHVRTLQKLPLRSEYTYTEASWPHLRSSELVCTIPFAACLACSLSGHRTKFVLCTGVGGQFLSDSTRCAMVGSMMQMFSELEELFALVTNDGST